MSSQAPSSTSIPDAEVPQSSVLFARGVIARLALWSTLRVAVQESWGGPNAAQKQTWLASVIVDTFEETHPLPDDQYIEELLLQVMADEFEVGVEDGSAESVARDLVKLWEETREGKQDGVARFEALAEKAKSRKVDVIEKVESDDEDWEDEDGEEDEEDDDAELEEEVPQLLDQRPKAEPEVDEDGFTKVKSKSKGRK